MMTPEDVKDLCLRVYRARLDAVCAGDADRQLAKDGDGGAKQRRRARFYEPAVRLTLQYLGQLPARPAPPPRRAARDVIAT